MQNQKLENQLNLALETNEALRMQSGNLQSGYDTRKNRWELIVKYSGDIKHFADDEIKVEELIAGYAIVTLPEDRIEAFSRREEIEYIEKPKRLFPQIQNSLAISCFDTVISKDYEKGALTGSGVCIAVIDSGIDYTLPLFRKEDGTSRILYLWDQGKAADNNYMESPPEGFSVGVEYAREQIDENLRMGQERKLLSQDVTGHGTAVASVLAQSAPSSNFILVKLDTSNQQSYPMTTSLMRAFTYVVKKAAALRIPVAINVSYGTTYGPHDGSSLLERFLDNISEIGQNVICVGSGNEGASAGHFSEKIEKETKVELAVGDYEYSLSLQIWKNYADLYEISLVSPGGESYRISQEGTQGGAGTVTLEQTRVLFYSGKPQPYRTKEEIYIELLPEEGIASYVNRGVWQIQIIPRQVVNGNLQMYLPSEVIRSSATRFLRPSPEATLTIPSTAERVITVGAYQGYFGAYADFSGRGYVVDAGQISEGLTKPDLVAPGVDIRVIGLYGEEVVSGTSYAVPFVTGACALLMEWGIIRGNDPYLYGEKVKAYLIRGARHLQGYEKWPNDMIGWGALCVADSIPL